MCAAAGRGAQHRSHSEPVIYCACPEVPWIQMRAYQHDLFGMSGARDVSTVPSEEYLAGPCIMVKHGNRVCFGSGSAADEAWNRNASGLAALDEMSSALPPATPVIERAIRDDPRHRLHPGALRHCTIVLRS